MWIKFGKYIFSCEDTVAKGDPIGLGFMPLSE